METVPTSVRRWLQARDLVWFALFAALGAVTPNPAPQEIAVLICLCVLQVAEPRIPWFTTDRGTVIAALLKIALSWVLIGWTGAISSTYWMILFLPIVTSAITLNAAGTAGITLLSSLAYVSFLLYVDWTRYEISPQAFGEIGLRVIFLWAIAFITHQMAEVNRVEARRYQAAAAQLEAANRNLQEAEAAVRRTERLAALGQLTAGLAHEMRNPLGTIRASAEMLAKNVSEENDIARELAGFIASEVDRTNSLITRFLEFARPVRLRLIETDLTQVIDGAIEELKRRNPPLPVTVHRNYAVDTPRAPADAELVGRVVYNLLLNAAQATPPGGTVTVRTRGVNGYAEILVIDRGYGIEQRNLESIFNPFFTTKPDGIGLGLPIVSKIVDDHGGRITVESEPGQGTVFRVYLPVPASGGLLPEVESFQEQK